MLVLLPPSERKAPPPRRGRPVDLSALVFPGLVEARGRVRDALMALGHGDEALAVLGVSPALRAEVSAHAGLPTAPSRPAMELFTGVLFDALAWAELDAGARRRASTRVLVMSALYGVVAPGDRVAGYRLAMGVDLPGVGPLGPLWRGVLGAPMQERAEQAGVLVDCRSAAHAAAWQPTGAAASGGVVVHVVREEAGVRRVVSHTAKHTRGEVTRCLLTSAAEHRGRDPRDADDVADRMAQRWRVELGPADPRGRRLRRLDIVLPG